MTKKSFESSKVVKATRQGKDTHFKNQKKRVFKAFWESPKTMLMASMETGILRANICRFKRQFEKTGTIFTVKRAKCKISKHKAFYLTTNKEFFESIKKRKGEPWK